MPNPTKFFISSVAQDTLTEIRNDTFDSLRDLGHAPEMYEKTFGPWPSDANGVEHCIKKVAESDVYCLFLHNKGGTMLENGRTVTHLEFIEAIRTNKVLILFAEKSLKKKYFSEIKWIIAEYSEHYKNETGRNANFVEIHNYLIVLSKNHDTKVPSADQVDPYVWLFMYDIIEVQKKYIEDLSLGVGIRWKEYLSDLLKQGVQLIPIRHEASESKALASAFGDFSELAIGALKQLSVKEVPNWSRLLATLRNLIVGTEVTEDFQYTNKAIGEIRECSAISVFYRDGELLKIRAAEGDTDGNRDFRLDDGSSFVALTYNNSSNLDPMLFYLESKKMFYLAFRVGEYIISYHFPEKTAWNQQMFLDYNELIIDGIINEHANSLIFNYFNAIVGGLQK